MVAHGIYRRDEVSAGYGSIALINHVTHQRVTTCMKVGYWQCIVPSSMTWKQNTVAKLKLVNILLGHNAHLKVVCPAMQYLNRYGTTTRPLTLACTMHSNSSLSHGAGSPHSLLKCYRWPFWVPPQLPYLAVYCNAIGSR